MLRSLLGLLVVALVCASPVRRRRETKIFDAVEYAKANNIAHGYFVDPHDCNKYYLAVKGPDASYLTYRFACMPGMHFDKATLTCLMGADCENLPTPCAKPGFFPDPNNCATFFRCANKQLYRMCCPLGTAWNTTLNSCDYNSECTAVPDCAEIAVASTTVGPEKSYCTDKNWRYEKVATDEKKFTQISLTDTDVSSVGVCPKGPFSTRECGCIDSTLDGKLVPEIKCEEFDFKNSFSTPLAYVQPIKSNLLFGAACMEADGFLKVPRYNNVGFGSHLTITIDYDNAGGDAILFSNGDCATPSVKIAIVGSEIEATVVTTDGTFTKKMAAPLEAEVTMDYNGEQLKLTIGDKEETLDATGSILRRQCDVTMGKNLTGCLKNVKIC